MIRTVATLVLPAIVLLGSCFGGEGGSNGGSDTVTTDQSSEVALTDATTELPEPAIPPFEAACTSDVACGDNASCQEGICVPDPSLEAIPDMVIVIRLAVGRDGLYSHI